MNTPAKILIAAVLTFAAADRAHADPLYVICHSGLSLDTSAVRDAFVGEKSFAGDVRLIPTDNSAAQTVFLEKILKMDAARYSTTWTKKSFREGMNPPSVVATDAEALEFVRRTPGACSYLTSTPSGVSAFVRR